ncbi:capsular polysaccharide transport system permease protein [Sphingobium fontiphilum]|uniref:Capsular polysaccharide transport system permease protein n=1 Tax=Sphingobium fontiphilum TaxID=944425 RepID=A0A7W6DJ61_9SPHN|nr:lipopolysaccharide biosynthesis protein [Sphingobium fontiphilum]MBB3981615.1 capsular polysaccharide transport system permease protein [Sphingobium fontiphilum]
MQELSAPLGHEGAQSRRIRSVIVRRLWRLRYFLMVVMLPTLIVGAYFAFFAADQYESEAHLLVRSGSGDRGGSGGIESMLRSVGGSGLEGAVQAIPLADYMRSHDVVASLRKNNNLVERYRRPEADMIARLNGEDPASETLLKYYRSRTDVELNTDTGILTVRVRTFRPKDSFELMNALLDLGEERVNALNERAYEVAIRQAKRQLGDAEAGLRKAQSALTAFRKGQSDIDPEGSGEAQLRLVTELRKDQALAEAEMQAIASQIGTNNPQYQALRSRASAISEQLNSQQSMLVGNSKSIASRLGDYQELQLRQEFESKRYSSAAASLEGAREQALRQQLFVVRLVQPSYPVKATYPKGLRGTVAVFLVLMLSYGIAWLLIAGVREHAA